MSDVFSPRQEVRVLRPQEVLLDKERIQEMQILQERKEPETIEARGSRYLCIPASADSSPHFFRYWHTLQGSQTYLQQSSSSNREGVRTGSGKTFRRDRDGRVVFRRKEEGQARAGSSGEKRGIRAFRAGWQGLHEGCRHGIQGSPHGRDSQESQKGFCVLHRSVPQLQLLETIRETLHCKAYQGIQKKQERSQRSHQWYRRVLVVCQARAVQLPRGFAEQLPFILERDGVPLQSSVRQPSPIVNSFVFCLI